MNPLKLEQPEQIHLERTGSQPVFFDEINERLKRRYLDRLSFRLRTLRKSLILRNWQALREDCQQLALSCETFGFTTLTRLAKEAYLAIPTGRLSRAAVLPMAKSKIEILITSIDTALIDSKR